MKIAAFLLFNIFVFRIAYSQNSEDCLYSDIAPQEIVSTASELQIPNCLHRNFFRSSQNGNLAALCGACQTNFNSSMRIHNRPERSSSSPINLQNVIIEALKKSISANILDVASLRSLPGNNYNFPNSQSSCSIDKLQEDLRMQSPDCANQIDFNVLKDQLNTEVANLVSNDYSASSEGIFIRPSSSSCNISDKELSAARFNSLDEELNSEVVAKLASITTNSTDDLSDLISEDQSLEAVLILMQDHPILSKLIKRPAEFKRFFSSLSNPINKHTIRAALYNPNNFSIVDQDIASKCTNAFNSFKSSVCSPDILDNKANINSLPIKNSILPVQVSDNEFITAPDEESQIQQNLEVLRICSSRVPDSNINLDLKLNDMTGWMDNQYQGMNFSDYRSSKYNNILGNSRTALCDKRTPCDRSEYMCRLRYVYESSLTPDSPEGRIAKSSSSELNRLLRTMMGTPKNISHETRRILIEQGILPQADGTIVPQPQIAERSPTYLAERAAASRQAPQAESASAVSAAPNKAKRVAAGNPATTYGTTDPQVEGSQVAIAAPGSSDFDQERFYNEMKRRLQPGQAPQAVQPVVAKPNTRNAQNIVSNPDSAIEANQAVAPTAPTVVSGVAPGFSNSNNVNTPDPTAGERARAQRAAADKTAALSGMHGAAGSRVNDASAANPDQANRAPASADAAIVVQASMDNLLVDLNRMLQQRDWADVVRGKVNAKQPIDMVINGTPARATFNTTTNRYVANNTLPANAKNQFEQFVNGLIAERPISARQLNSALTVP